AHHRHPGGRHGGPDGAERLPRGGGMTSTTPTPPPSPSSVAPSSGVTTRPGEPVLVVRDQQAHVAGQQVVEHVDLEVAPTGVTALLGRNGVGKTSTNKAVM